MKSIFGLLLVVSFCTIQANAQTKVTFNVNLKPMLEDSSFVPGKHVLQVKGDFFPFTATTRFEMKDLTPKDSVYSVTLTFPRRFTNKMLTYNYVIRSISGSEMNEFLPRQLDLKGREVELPPFYFDSFPN